MNNLATQYNMDEQLLNRFYHKEYAPTEEQTWKALKAATYVPISTAFKVKQNLDKENTDVTKISNNFQDSVTYHDCDCSPMGSQIDLPNKIILKSDYYVSLIVTMFKNIAAMNALLIENHNKLVSSLKNLVFKKNIRKEHVDSFYKEANLKSDTKFETFWKKITEVFDDWSFVCDTETPVNSHESRVLVYVSKRNCSTTCPISFNQDFKLVAWKKSPVAGKFNLKMFRYVPRYLTVELDFNNEKINYLSAIDTTLFEQPCRLHVYLKLSSTPQGVKNFLSGQEKIKCPQH